MVGQSQERIVIHFYQTTGPTERRSMQANDLLLKGHRPIISEKLHNRRLLWCWEDAAYGQRISILAKDNSRLPTESIELQAVPDLLQDPTERNSDAIWGSTRAMGEGRSWLLLSLNLTSYCWLLTSTACFQSSGEWWAPWPIPLLMWWNKSSVSTVYQRQWCQTDDHSVHKMSSKHYQTNTTLTISHQAQGIHRAMAW